MKERGGGREKERERGGGEREGEGVSYAMYTIKGRLLYNRRSTVFTLYPRIQLLYYLSLTVRFGM